MLKVQGFQTDISQCFPCYVFSFFLSQASDQYITTVLRIIYLLLKLLCSCIPGCATSTRIQGHMLWEKWHLFLAYLKEYNKRSKNQYKVPALLNMVVGDMLSHLACLRGQTKEQNVLLREKTSNKCSYLTWLSVRILINEHGRAATKLSTMTYLLSASQAASSSISKNGLHSTTVRVFALYSRLTL